MQTIQVIANKRRLAPIIALILLLTSTLPVALAAPEFNNSKFQITWEYSDKLVDEQPGAGRGYTWGPHSFGIVTENYVEGLNGKRPVQYFDKSRMELSANSRFVTNGLLAKELVTGLRQDGDDKFTQLQPSTVQVAGDPNNDGANALAPVYSSFKGVISFNPGENSAANRVGAIVNQSINKAGEVKTLDNPPVQLTIGEYQPTLGHNVPQVFLDFQNQSGLVWNGGNYLPDKIYTSNPTSNVFGYANSEAFWTRAVVAGQEKDVLVQLFERRVLTYTPSNNDPYKVEMGNIGQHYYRWRYSNATPAPANIIVNSGTIDAGDTKIPQQYLDAARDQDVLFNHQSVGYNIMSGLDRLASSNPTRYSLVRSSEPAVGWYSTKNGLGDFTRGSNLDPASKINGFKALIDSEGYGAVVKIAMMKFCYVDSEGITDYNTIWIPYRDTMLYLEGKYPGVKFVWWTMPLQTDGNQFRDNYNTQVRNYATANNKILFDIADIESHDPGGNAITDGGYSVMYSPYSSDGGHLTDAGAERVARGWWWLMARLSGWNGQ